MSKPALNARNVAGWFGKIPNLGDFASRRLPDALVRRWDRWLQGSLAQARDELGSEWQAAYLVAPILRFWVGAGARGGVCWAGLLMPSVDRVGRHFPLTVAMPCPTLAAALAARSWFAALDAAARKVLDVDFTADDFDAALAGIAPIGAALPGAAEQPLAARLIARCAAGKGVSVWWHDSPHDADDEAAYLCFAGLPPEAEFTSMLGVTT